MRSCGGGRWWAGWREALALAREVSRLRLAIVVHDALGFAMPRRRARRSWQTATSPGQLRSEFIGLIPLVFEALIFLTSSPTILQAPQTSKFYRSAASENQLYGTQKRSIHRVFKQFSGGCPDHINDTGCQAQNHFEQLTKTDIANW